MPKGIEAESADGFVTLTFIDRSLRGHALAKILDVVGPEFIDVSTGGTLRSYTVPEFAAREAGLLDEPDKEPLTEPDKKPLTEPDKKAPAKKAPAKKAPAKKAPAHAAAPESVSPFISKAEGEWA